MSTQKRSSSKENKEKGPRTPEKSSAEDKLLQKYDGIIVRHPKEGNFFCNLCNDEGSPYFSGLWNNCKDHMTSQAHKKSEEKSKKFRTESKEATPTETETNQGIIEEKVSSAKNSQELTPAVRAQLNLIYSRFLLQYRLPFNLVSPLNTFTKQVSAEYGQNILQEYTISRKTVTKATKVLCNTMKADIYESLRSSPFSLSLDTSIDSYGSTYLAICARLLEVEDYDKPQMRLISILPITTSSTGETLHKMILENIQIDDELKQNFVGVATDDGGNMTGVDQGVTQRLKETCNYS